MLLRHLSDHPLHPKASFSLRVLSVMFVSGTSGNREAREKSVGASARDPWSLGLIDPIPSRPSFCQRGGQESKNKPQRQRAELGWELRRQLGIQPEPNPHRERKPAPSALASPSPVEMNKVRYDSSCESDRGRKTSTSNSEFQM